MKKLLSFFAAFLFAGSMMAADPVEITSGTFNGKDGTYTEGWSTNGTGKGRTDCVIIGAGENITSPSVDLSQYESISIAIKARRFGTLSGSKAQIAVTFGGENVGSTEASGTSATTSLSAIEYTVVAATAKTGNFVVTCSNATSAGSTHGAGINSIVITGVKKASQGGQGGGETPSTVKTVYCKAAQDWWRADGAAVGVYAFKGETHNAEWPGVRMIAVEGETDLWKADIDTAAYSAIIFTRMNPSNEGGQDWGAKTADLTIPADKDLYTITSTSAVWGDPGVTGTWSVYGEEPVVVEPTLVYAISGAWHNFDKDLFEVATDGKTASFSIDLEAGDYEFKIRKDDAWLTKANNGVAYGLHREWTGVAGVVDDASENLKLTADENGVYTFVWTFANDSIGINFPAKHTLNELWKVTAETALAAGTKYVDNYAVEISSVFGTTLKANTRAFEGYSFTHAIQVRNAAYPSADELAGTEQSGSTSLVITAKENVELAFFYNRQSTDNTGAAALNDGKDMKIFDQAAPTTALECQFKVVWMQEDKKYVNAIKTIALVKGHVYTVSAKGTTIQLSGIRYVSDAVAPAEPAKYFLKNNWDAAENWTWKEMTKDGETYKLERVVFGGTGVNYNTAESDEGSVWVALEDMEGDVIEAKDTVTFVLNPADGTITATLVGAFSEPIDLEDCDWENIAFVGGPAEYAEQFKVCKPENVNVVNIQNPAWSTKTQMGIYMTFPAASFGNITLDEDLYEIQGAGILFFLSAFTAQETEFIVNCEGNNLAITVYNVKADGPELEHAYTVAGSSDAVFGTAWDPTNTDNDMVKQEDGTYKFVKANVVLPAGAIGFKVCEDYAWDVAYPANNYQLNIAEAGEYTITITFDPETKAVAATADKTAVVEVDPTVSAKGSWDEWTNEIPFVLSDDKTTATLTIANVAAGTYEFKVILNGGDWRSNAHVFTRTDAEAEGINGNDNTNMKLIADVEGEYVFTWTFATNSLSVEFPDGEVVEPTLENGYYLVGDFNDWTPAAEYLFAANEGADGEFVLNTSLEGATELKVVYVVNDQNVTWFGANNYQIPEELRREVVIYFRPNANTDWSALDGHLYIMADTADAIDNLDANGTPVKIIRNGQIFILRGEQLYNAQGQLVK